MYALVAGLFVHLFRPGFAQENVNVHEHATMPTHPSETHGAHAEHEAHANTTMEVVMEPNRRRGALLVAADRGFLGNEEIRDAAAEFSLETGDPIEIVFMTDERSQARLDTALTVLTEAGCTDLTVLPLFLSDDHPRLALAREMLASREDLVWADPFGASYYAVEVLADRLRDLERTQRHHTILTGYGATTAENRQAMEADLERLLAQAAEDTEFRSAQSVVFYEYESENQEELQREVVRELIRILLRPGRTAIVPFNLSIKLDSMMSMNGFLQQILPDRVQVLREELLPHPAVALWMERETRRSSLTMEDLGVVFVAHGADFEWNEVMRQAGASLAEDYRLEFSFSMADPPVIERAIRRLEERGAEAIVVVRVFGMSSSFLPTVHRALGMDIEGVPGDGHTGHHGAGHGEGHGHHGMDMGGSRIRTAALLTTTGGIDDHALFAEALFERARALSEDPANETIVLVAHGAGSDERNDFWRQTLDSLAEQMSAMGGDAFRAIHTGTWREDWPDKREPEIARIRGFVEEGSRDGGRVIVVPARTTLQGPAPELLEGLDFVMGSGFAPSPQFTRWVEDRILEGAAQLGIEGVDSPVVPPSDTHHHHGH